MGFSTRVLAVASLAAMVAAVPAAHVMAQADGIAVTVKYTGKGDVDDSHRLWIWLFDTPEIGAGSIPVAELSLSKNGDTASFSGVAAKQVWIAVAFDEQGGFAGMAPPPSGSPVGVHSEGGGPPSPVTPGARVTVTFDDSQRMP